MGIADMFKGKQYKAELEKSNKEIEEMKSMFTPEMQEADSLRQMINSMKEEKETLGETIARMNHAVATLDKEIKDKKNLIITLDDEILFQEFGLYKPRYDFANSTQYKIKLNSIREQQKEMIKAGTAVTANTNWTVNNSASQGKKMVKDMQKLFLRAFNSDCEEVISKVKYNNFDASLKKITASKDAISKLGTVMSLSISMRYYELKVQELALAFEYAQKKQEEKEEQKMLREQMREEAKLQREIEEARKSIEKEKRHYSNALDRAERAYAAAKDDIDKEIWKEKLDELKAHLVEIEKNLKDIDYREANKRAGYVYIISNIGSFGENVYKIGMTRRLDPQDRVDELGDASVPFNFDVHAMIFSDDAPKLEAALHNEFSDRKINMVNQRREFFRVTLDEIEEAVKKNFDKSVEFKKFADAEQYRQSLKMKEM